MFVCVSVCDSLPHYLSRTEASKKNEDPGRVNQQSIWVSLCACVRDSSPRVLYFKVSATGKTGILEQLVGS